MLLSDLKQIAEEYLGHAVSDVVISVPGCFNSSQRELIKSAGKMAGFNVHRLIDDNTATVLAYGLNRKSSISKNILVFDMGGGTLSVSVI